MTETAGTEFPIEVESAECSPAGADQVLVYVRGRWRRRGGPGRAVLVVPTPEQRHRFSALPGGRRVAFGRHGLWSASFALPTSLVPRLSDGAELWVDNLGTVLPEVNLAAGGQLEAGDAAGDASSGPIELVERIRRHSEDPSAGAAVGEPAGPDASAARQETSGALDAEDEVQQAITRLHADLQRRAEAEARLRGELAQARAELDARAANQAKLERAHAALRAELSQLEARLDELSALGAERDRLAHELERLRPQVAAERALREAAARENEGLREEIDRIARELATASGPSAGADTALGEAESLLEEARSLRARVRPDGP